MFGNTFLTNQKGELNKTFAVIKLHHNLIKNIIRQNYQSGKKQNYHEQSIKLKSYR